MNKYLFSCLLLLIMTGAFAQQKKVAVVTFYVDKKVDLSAFGLETAADLLKLEQDPNFNMEPPLSHFHQEFFDNYAKNFPFALVPETEVTGNPAYQALAIEDEPYANKEVRYAATPGYKVIDYNWGTKNEKNLLALFKQYDGIMFVYLSFKMEKGFAINGNGTTKMRAYTHIVLLNRDDQKVFNINESATSKTTGVVVGNLPIMKPEKILPMCESALAELMEDLQKRIPKLIKKADAKL
ncbi:hypothetical protein [Mucilaginibacter sp. L3T2-6]|uniref:hypothetical protein n=1 Tax=Mucilaginibacter sp. L3T2-6 TaxID=3062491 RepID=UPI002675D55B|nr:hypothetical protein [Mucilaginibacter sp. L3T2-6]MDO3641335.1 hypothetical protein [Mucilaginibacter sp. L3T2-6]MDV6213904.1 hypothetical protein [Mucilaginibacter sp. L3T2-6]